ncbi:outer membrane lipoprotein-sorting protein [Veronia pacifica]|uniref:Uncharacterized protein TP-0789 domain-containing protein n=1 Tax=Veronia pacifica TaxID=1080227 RepID=A0A1C3EMA4_9GAMM|nr:outer membrane lipoprotein-sorting protein [Veronia pacifica]ODA34377.1 hypothetical protein A8L45_06540 [Veronia pacifica]
MRTSYFLAIFFINTQLMASEALDGLGIAEKMQTVDSSWDSKRHGIMVTNRDGQNLSRSLVSYQQRSEKEQRSLIRFSEPADIRNTRFLSWTYENPDVSDDLWIYLPGENLTRRISGRGGKTSSFMRSDFNNEDIEKRFLNDDSHQLLRSEQLFGTQAYVVDFTPINKKESNYSKRTIWVNANNWLPMQVHYFDKSGQHFKTATYGGVKKIGDIWTVTKIKMETPRQNSVTLLQYSDIAYNTGLPDSLFTQASLSR